LELKNNCFKENEATLAPVVIHSSSHRLSSNGGRDNIIYDQQCDFAMEFTGASTVNRNPSDEIPFACFSFDMDTCFDDDKAVEADTAPDSSSDSGSVYGNGAFVLISGLTVVNCFSA
jgi:hypothetical protein